MLLNTAVPLFTTVLFVCVQGFDRTVTFSTLCGDGKGYDKGVYSYGIYSVEINTANWPSYKESCTVVFKAMDSSDNLRYEFHNYDQSDTGITVTFESKYGYSYTQKARYMYFSTPSIGSVRYTSRYLKVTVSRRRPYVATLRANFDVYTNSHVSTINYGEVPEHEYNYQYTYLGVGSIVAIAFGVIAAVVGIIMAIVCCVIRSSKGRRNGGVVMATGVANPNGPTLTITNAPVYPFVAPPQQHTVHPAYPAYPAYPDPTAVSPPAYPGQTAHPGQTAASPPAYPGQTTASTPAGAYLGTATDTAANTADEPGKVKD